MTNTSKLKPILFVPQSFFGDTSWCGFTLCFYSLRELKLNIFVLNRCSCISCVNFAELLFIFKSFCILFTIWLKICKFISPDYGLYLSFLHSILWSLTMLIVMTCFDYYVVWSWIFTTTLYAKGFSSFNFTLSFVILYFLLRKQTSKRNVKEARITTIKNIQKWKK